MKTAIIGDIHVGVRSGNKHFRKFIKKYLWEITDKLFDMGIRMMIGLGDLTDNQTSIQHQDHDVITEWFEYLRSKGMKFICIVGNHDSTFKHKITSNTPRKLSDKFDNILVIDKPTWIGPDLYLPWICSDNRDECLKEIDKGGRYCFAHLELCGYKMNPSYTMEAGMNDSLFAGFKQVFTGHYHMKSVKGNIRYVGTPYPITRVDMGCVRGIHTLDFETEELIFIESDPHQSLLQEIVYDGSETIARITKYDSYSHVRGTILNVICTIKMTPGTRAKLKEYINTLDLIDLEIIEEKALEVTDIKLDDSGAPIISESIFKTDTKKAMETYVNGCELDDTEKNETIEFLNNVFESVMNERDDI